jgi:hypothetical protein
MSPGRTGPTGNAGKPGKPGRLAALRRFARPAPAPARAEEQCEMCGAGLGSRRGDHGHVVGLDQRVLRCACRACYLLFTSQGAGGGRFRSVPERYLTDPAHRLTGADWDELQIPVTTAFLFLNSDRQQVVAGCPSPAGLTECLLDPDAWERARRTHPLLAAALADLEAVYVTRVSGAFEAFLIPIDACYALVGEVRLGWHGLDGGAEVRRVLTAFADDLRRRSRPMRPQELCA